MVDNHDEFVREMDRLYEMDEELHAIWYRMAKDGNTPDMIVTTLVGYTKTSAKDIIEDMVYTWEGAEKYKDGSWKSA